MWRKRILGLALAVGLSVAVMGSCVAVLLAIDSSGCKFDDDDASPPLFNPCYIEEILKEKKTPYGESFWRVAGRMDDASFLFLSTRSETRLLRSAPNGAASGPSVGSPPVNPTDGNPWRELGVWTADASLTKGKLQRLTNLTLAYELPLDSTRYDVARGQIREARFDLRAEIYRNGTELIVAGEANCVLPWSEPFPTPYLNWTADGPAHVVDTTEANPALATELLRSVFFPEFDSVEFDGATDVLSIRLLVRAGTGADPNGGVCGDQPVDVYPASLTFHFGAQGRVSRLGLVFED